MQDFRDLKVYQRAHELVLEIYRRSASFPDSEKYGLTRQMRRAAVSVPANIAEGTMRSSDPDFARFLHISMGSASEVDYYLILARDLGFLNGASYERLNSELQDVKRMLNGLLARVKPLARS